MNRFNNYEEFLNESLDPLNHLTQEQVDWCDKHIDGEWSVNSKGEVTVRKDLIFKDKTFDRFPVQFANVGGNFHCNHCSNLVSLEGAPQSVGGDFNCFNCPNLVSLEGAPQEVKGDFYCHRCPNLVSLKGAPQRVGGDFRCSHCDKLVSLEGAPQEVKGYFYCGHCPKLPDYFDRIIEDYNDKRIDWKQAHKLIHSETGRKAHSIGLI